MTTPNLELPEVPLAILTAADELNAGLFRTDAVLQLAVVSRIVTAPPSSAVQGQRWIIPPAATGAWLGRTNHVAYRAPDGWRIYVPRPGWLAWSIADGKFYVFAENVWNEFESGGGGITVTGIDDAITVPDVSEIAFQDAEVSVDSSGVLVKVSPLTAKGDLYTHDGTKVARLAVQANGTYLKADDSQPNGMAWSSSVPVGEAASACRTYKNATQSIADSTLVALTWPVEAFDTDIYHSTSSNQSRFVAPLAGKYVVGCTVEWDANTSGKRELYVVVNGTTTTKIAGALDAASAGLVQNCTTALDLAATDYVEFYVRQDSGGARNVGATTQQVSTAWIARIGVTAAPTQLRGATWARAGGAIVAVNTNEVHVRCPVKGVIVGWSIGTVGGPGSCSVDVRKANQANYPPDIGDTIVAGNYPAVSSSSTAVDSALTGWDTQVDPGDWLAFTLLTSTVFRVIFFSLSIRETQ